MILQKIVHNWHEARLVIETDRGAISFTGVQASHVLNSAPWGKSAICKEFRVLQGDDISLAVFFMESRDVITVAAERVELPDALASSLLK